MQRNRIPPVEIFRRKKEKRKKEKVEKLKGEENKERHLHKEVVDNREGEGLVK